MVAKKAASASRPAAPQTARTGPAKPGSVVGSGKRAPKENERSRQHAGPPRRENQARRATSSDDLREDFRKANLR
eukprot:5881649-Heterocapsa_arctica.AAC.1